MATSIVAMIPPVRGDLDAETLLLRPCRSRDIAIATVMLKDIKKRLGKTGVSQGVDREITDGAFNVIVGRGLLWMWILRILFTRSG